MKSFKNIFAWVILLSFALGAWWGFRLVQKRQVPTRTEIHALAFKNSVPTEVIQALVEKRKTRIHFDWVSTPEEWFDKISSHTATYDLVFSYHFQAELLAAQNQIRRIDRKSLQNLSQISVDFLQMPFNQKGLYAVPLFWGAMGFIFDSNKLNSDQLNWQTLWSLNRDQKIALRASLYDSLTADWSTLQKSKKKPHRAIPHTPAYVTTSPLEEVLNARAWVSIVSHAEFARLKNSANIQFQFAPDQIPYWAYTVSISKNSKNILAARQAIDSLIADDIARIFLLKGDFASTHKTAEKMKSSEKLKPSYFRKLDLTRLKSADSFWLF